MTDKTPENASDTDTIQPVPAWIKQGGLALLALIILLIIWMIFSGNDNESSSNLVDLESTSENFEPNKQELQRELDVAPQKLDFSKEKMSVFNEDALPQAGLQHDYKLLKQQITRLQEDVKNMDARFIQDQKRQDDITDMLKKMLEMMQSDITDMKKMVRKQPISLKKVRYKRQTKPKKTVAIPLTLVSIDQWGSDYYAVVRYQGRLQDITVGQTLLGWTLESINHQQGQASFRNAQGITRFLSVM